MLEHELVPGSMCVVFGVVVALWQRELGLEEEEAAALLRCVAGREALQWGSAWGGGPKGGQGSGERC